MPAWPTSSADNADCVPSHLSPAIRAVGEKDADGDAPRHPSIRQIPPQCVDPKIKCRSRMHYFLADQEARLVDPEASDAAELAGNVTETSTANIILVEPAGSPRRPRPIRCQASAGP